MNYTLGPAPSRASQPSVFNRLIGYFVRGALATVPILATGYLLYWIVSTVDGLLGIKIPGLGLVLAVAIVTSIGFALSNVVGRRVFGVTDRWLARVPLIKLIYTSIRDLISAFMGERKKFGRPVAVRPIPGSDIRFLGFLTRDDLRPLGFLDHVAVYFPQAYNVAGQVMIVPRTSIDPLPVLSSELITFLVSGGASGFGLGTPTIPPPPPETQPPPPVADAPPPAVAPPPPGIVPSEGNEPEN